MAKNAIRKCNPEKSQKELNLIYAEVHYGPDTAKLLREFYLRQDD